MPGQHIPLFPLHVVVFPRTVLPLHIFEDRYKEMVGAAIRDDTEFGIVLAKQNGILNAGCTVVVEKVLQMYPDGRMDILTRGKRRFEILSVSDEKEWLEAEVEFFDDEDTEDSPEDLKSQVLKQYEDLKALMTEETPGETSLSDRQLSFQLAQSLQDLDFLGLLLRSRSETDRLKELAQYLALYIPRQKAVQRMKQLAPTNGHGRRPSEL